ncbi:hypothetical protein HAX54_049528, partial [Datura stramonium]|nr:hypothetical protein [Datura stramonium]
KFDELENSSGYNEFEDSENEISDFNTASAKRGSGKQSFEDGSKLVSVEVQNSLLNEQGDP